jgi:8-oxo-dGTP pyrophosphatase MutT (NUDIX family)
VARARDSGTLLAMRRVRASAVCVHEGLLLCVRLRDPVSRVARLFPPGGAIEDGEAPAAAAERETREETGYAVQVDPASELIARYPFVWAGVDVDVTTHFFRARLRGERRAPMAVHDAAYNEGAIWLPLPGLERELGFCSAIYAAVRALTLPLTR